MTARRDWGESGALLLCVALFIGLRHRYTLGPPFVTFGMGVLVAAAFVASLYSAMDGARRAARWVSIAGAVILASAVVMSLAKVVLLVVYHANTVDATRLIESSLMIWVNNVVVFALAYYLIGEREFLFPRSEQAAKKPLVFLDYVFLSFTTATAFSPTDTSPLSTRARMLMMVESVVSLLVVAIVAARAVNILPQ